MRVSGDGSPVESIHPDEVQHGSIASPMLLGLGQMSPRIGHMTTKPKASLRLGKRQGPRRLRGLDAERSRSKRGPALGSDPAGLTRVVALIKRKDENALISAVEMGVSVAVAHALPGAFHLAGTEIAGLLGVSSKTAQRWRLNATQRLTQSVGEKAVRLLQLRQLAIETFEDEEDAVAWLNEANEAFGGRRPIDHAHTELGCQQVERLLIRIDEGIFS